MKTILTLLTLALAAPAAHAQRGGFDFETALNGNCGNIREVSTYGKDNREDYCAQDMFVRDLADSVAALFTEKNGGIAAGGQTYAFGTNTLGNSQNLSAGQRFADEPAASYCSGFLVGDDLLVTAGHCVLDHRLDAKTAANAAHDDPGCQENLTVKSEFCENIKIVFGFRKELGGVIPRSVPADNVYRCARVLAHSMKSGPDYALIKLDRKVAGRRPLAIDRGNADLAEGVPLMVIGHPSGLPLKIAADAKVLAAGRDVSVTDGYGVSRPWVHKEYSFLANLDTFHGNSGSPVINLKTLLVEGILVSGDADYEWDPEDPGKRRAANYPQDAGSTELGKGVGEVCTKISVPQDRIPATRRERDMRELNRQAGGDLYGTLLRTLRDRAVKTPGRVIQIPNYALPGTQAPAVVPAVYVPVPEPTPAPGEPISI